jgi:hypothetical protein
MGLPNSLELQKKKAVKRKCGRRDPPSPGYGEARRDEGA